MTILDRKGGVLDDWSIDSKAAADPEHRGGGKDTQMAASTPRDQPFTLSSRMTGELIHPPLALAFLVWRGEGRTHAWAFGLLTQSTANSHLIRHARVHSTGTVLLRGPRRAGKRTRGDCALRYSGPGPQQQQRRRRRPAAAACGLVEGRAQHKGKWKSIDIQERCGASGPSWAGRSIFGHWDEQSNDAPYVCPPAF